MKARLMVAATLVLLALASAAPAQDLVPRIGLYADMAGTICEADLPLMVSTNVYVVAILGTEPHQPQTLKAARFYVENFLNLSPPIGFTSIAWANDPEGTAPLVIGNISDPVDGFSIAFTHPFTGPIVRLGTISYVPFAAQANDILMSVKDFHPSSGDENGTVMIADASAYEHLANGMAITLNCTVNCECVYSEVPVNEASWSEIKSLY